MAGTDRRAADAAQAGRTGGARASGRCRAAGCRAAGDDGFSLLLVEDAAKALIGSSLDDAALEKAAAACRAACKPIDDKRGTIVYRTKIAGVLLKRATAIAAERAAKN